MEQMNASGLQALEHLHMILDAGGRGYSVAAASVNKRALKMLFKTYARQRADFRRRLYEQAGKNVAKSRRVLQLLAMVHPGRIDIFETLTIGEQNRGHVVLQAVLVGARSALRAYERALRKDLPPDTTQLVQTQFHQVQAVVEHTLDARRARKAACCAAVRQPAGCGART